VKSSHDVWSLDLTSASGLRLGLVVRTQVWSGISIDVHTILLESTTRIDKMMIINVSIIERYRSGSSLFICTWFSYDTFEPVQIAPGQRISYLSTIGSIYILLFKLESDRPYSNLGKLIVSIVKSAVFVVGTFVFVNVHP
jgi:hypothetical protein